MTGRPAIFAAALVSGVLVGVLPVLVFLAGLALWCHAEDTYKKNHGPRSRRRPRLAPSG